MITFAADPAADRQIATSTRRLTAGAGALYAALGLVLFLAPAWASTVFAWAVSPMVTITIGGWCLGNAGCASLVVRAPRWPSAWPLVLYLTAFAVLELAVVVTFADRLRLCHPVAWLYLATLVAGAAASGAALVELAHRRPPLTAGGPGVPVVVRVLLAVFVLFVAVLAIGGGRADLGGWSSEGAVFPEPLSLSIRAFAAFFGALAISALPLLWPRTLAPMLTYLRGGLALVAPILLAAAVHAGSFDLATRPGGALYLGAYLAALVVGTLILILAPAPATLPLPDVYAPTLDGWTQ